MFALKKLTAIEKMLYQMLAKDICQHLIYKSLLDVGCGDGKLAVLYPWGDARYFLDWDRLFQKEYKAG